MAAILPDICAEITEKVIAEGQDSSQVDLMRGIIIFCVLALGGCEDREMMDVKDAVSRNLLDPGATQFRDLKRCSGDQEVWQGEFNGKNAFGAYTGFKPFFYEKYRASTVGDDDFMALMDKCYSDLKSKAAPVQSGSLESDSGSATDSAIEVAEEAADAAERAAIEAQAAIDKAEQ
jgi:hypothetical protein